METEEQTYPEIGDYVLLETIGSGSYGKVKLGKNKLTEQKVAIKIIKKSTIEAKSDMSIKIRREIGLMRLFNHPHLLKLFDVLESSRHLYIVMEYAAHGELFDFLQEQNSLSVEFAVRLFRQIIYGLEFLHVHSICHRDIKPENILLDSHDNIKIADFGFARWMKDNTAVTACGSPHYIAPEVIIGLPYDGRSADIWSCGVLFYTLMCGRLPFDEPTVRKLLLRVRSGKFVMPDLPADIKDLIQRMLTVEPKERITLSQIKQHRAFRIGLSPFYVCPTPQPIPEKLPVYEVKKLKESEIDVLHQLGFTDEEIQSELETEEHTLAKEFCFMMKGVISFDAIDWELTEVKQQPFIIEPFEPKIPEKRIINSLSEAQTSSFTSFSIIERSMFCIDQDSGEVEKEKRTIVTACPVETLMNALQSFLNEMNFKWVHPDDLLLLARSKGDESLDIAINDVPLDETMHSVEITMMSIGSTELFDDFVEKVSTLIENIVF
jgi:BR serine/threonine kinase